MQELSRLRFVQAAEQWLEIKRAMVSPASVADYQNCLNRLAPFFGELRLGEIHVGHLVEYQRARQAEIRQRHPTKAERTSDGATRINREIVTLGQVLSQAGLWEKVRRFYRPLPLAESPGMALEREEEEHLFQLARSRPRWRVAYWASVLSQATTASPGEIRHLQVRDVDLARGLLYVRHGVKNQFRVRALPLNDDARRAAQELVDRYQEMCTKYKLESLPEHYLFFHRAGTKNAVPDPHRPASGWRRAWDNLRKAAAKKYPRLAKLRRYDLRHTAITKLLEDPMVSERTVEEMAGHHINSKTKDRYSHIKLEAKRAAAQTLSLPPRKPILRMAPLRLSFTRKFKP